MIAEIGVDMGRFPTAGHLASWAGLCPGNHESAGKRRSGKARKGDAALRVALCEAAWSAARTRDTYLAAQFRRFSRRMGKTQRGQSDLRGRPHHDRDHLARPQRHAAYDELGGDYFDRHTDTEADARRHVAPLDQARPPSHPHTRRLNTTTTTPLSGATPRPRRARTRTRPGPFRLRALAYNSRGDSEPPRRATLILVSYLSIAGRHTATT